MQTITRSSRSAQCRPLYQAILGTSSFPRKWSPITPETDQAYSCPAFRVQSLHEGGEDGGWVIATLLWYIITRSDRDENAGAGRTPYDPCWAHVQALWTSNLIDSIASSLPSNVFLSTLNYKPWGILRASKNPVGIVKSLCGGISQLCQDLPCGLRPMTIMKTVRKVETKLTASIESMLNVNIEENC